MNHINSQFDLLAKRLKLTPNQKKDARTKIEGVVATLNETYYNTKSSEGHRLVIGSYGKHTNIRPPSDIDLIYKIPKDTYEKFKSYESNGQEALLQEIRKTLAERYPVTEMHGWIKVVAVGFSEGTHRVEILPGYEQEDGTFIIPNTENGGSWEIYDAREDLGKIKKLSSEERQLIKFIKHWQKKTPSANFLSSYDIENYIIDFLKVNSLGGSWSLTIEEFFTWLLDKITTEHITVIETAQKRAEKAYNLEKEKKYRKACEEWRKIFPYFSICSDFLSNEEKLTRDFPSENEEYIEDLFKVDIRSSIKLDIEAKIKGKTASGWDSRYMSFETFIGLYKRIPHFRELKFTPRTDYEGDVSFFWKVRNFGQQAKEDDGLRGEIRKSGSPDGSITETTKYDHPSHYVECYMIENGICVTRKKIIVPIKGVK